MSADVTPTSRPERPGPERRVAVVLNGAAGALLGRSDAADALSASFAEAGLTPVLIPNEAGDLPRRMTLACQTGASAIVVAGGDGTVACAAEIASAAGVTLGILPFGTMNLLAKDLDLPIGDLAAAIRVIADGHVREIDAADVNGRLFLCASMLGLPTRLARHREAGRGGESKVRLWTRFARAALRGFARYRSPRFVVQAGGQSVRVRAASLTITANALDEAPGKPFRRARLDGGELGFYLIRSLRLRDAGRLAIRLALGRWRQDADVEERLVPELTIRAKSRAVRVMNDGEAMLLEPPLHYRIRPRALRVFAPRPPASQP